MITLSEELSEQIKKMILYALSIFIIVISTLCKAEEFMFPTCKRNSTDFSICLKSAIQESWPQFLKGLPEFDFPHLEPFLFKFGKLKINTNAVYGEAIVQNVTIFNFTSTRFLDVRPQFLDDVFRLEIDAFMPNLFIHGYVSGDANIIGIRATGTGQVNITIEEMRATWDITGHVKNDKWTIEHFQIRADFGKLNVHLSGFFDDNKILNNLLEDFINQYWPPIYRAVYSILFDVIDPVMVDLTNSFFSKVSFSQVFP